jgi:hypothetical protein
VQKPVWILFALRLSGDVLFTVYTVPSIAISRGDQRPSALAKLRLPRSALQHFVRHEFAAWGGGGGVATLAPAKFGRAAEEVSMAASIENSAEASWVPQRMPGAPVATACLLLYAQLWVQDRSACNTRCVCRELVCMGCTTR